MYKGSLSAVSSDLELPLEYPGKADLFWESQLPSVIREDGHIDFINASQNQRVTLRCTAKAGDFEDQRDFTVVLDKASADLSADLEERAALLAEELSGDSKGEILLLPDEYEGAGLSWSLPVNSSSLMLILLLLLCGLALYFSRYDALERELKARSEAFSMEIPNMSLQLILLLNAGLVASAAFEELVQQNRNSRNPLYRHFSQLMEQAKDSNSSFSAELYRLAARSESKEFIRFANMVYENSARGSQLAEKLEWERSSMWNSRMSSARAKAKAAETKLSFPLILLLLSVVIISIAPAMLKMHQ